MNKSFVLAVVVDCLLCSPKAAHGQWAQVDKELSPSTSSSRFGWSVAIEGNLALVGDPGDGFGDGAAYVYQRNAANTWDLVQTLFPPDSLSEGQFGNAVDLVNSGGTCVAIVGANFSNSFKGTALIYDCGNWGSPQKITASDAMIGDAFGASVSISAGRAVVGATGNNGGGVSNAGAAYVFEPGLGGIWAQTAKLIAGDPQGAGNFGMSVAVSGGRIAVGASMVDVNGAADAGAAYVFDLAGASWTQSAKLVAGDPDALDKMGWSIALSGGYVLTGAIGDDSVAQNSGAAYAFRRDANGWVQDQKIKAFDAEASDQFGVSVAMTGSWAAVGAPSEDQGGFSAGAIYTFERDGCGWLDHGKIVPSNAAGATLGQGTQVGFRSVSMPFPQLPKSFAVVLGGAAGANTAYWFEQPIPGYTRACPPRNES